MYFVHSKKLKLSNGNWKLVKTFRVTLFSCVEKREFMIRQSILLC